MSLAALDWEYKALFQMLTEELGRPPGIHDPDYWELTEWHRKECEALVNARKPAESYTEVHKGPLVVEEVLSPPLVEWANPNIPIVERSCRDCGVVLTKKPGRGRWPIRCEECR